MGSQHATLALALSWPNAWRVTAATCRGPMGDNKKKARIIRVFL